MATQPPLSCPPVDGVCFLRTRAITQMTAATESIAADGYTVAVAAVQIGVRVAGVLAALSISRRVRVVRPAVRHVANAHRALVGTLATVACMAQIDHIEYGSCSDMNAKDAATTTIVHQNTCAKKKVSQISAPDLVIPGARKACVNSMPTKSNGRTTVGSKFVVVLKSVKVKSHDEYGDVFAESDGGHAYYAMSKVSGKSPGPKINLPCLAHESVGTSFDIDTEVAEVSCGDTFRFGIWEDDPISDDPMGDRWFSTLDFLTSQTVSFNTNTSKVSFVLHCEGCFDSCTEANSLLTTFSKASSGVSYSKSLSDVVDVEDKLPVGLWNYDADTQTATEQYVLAGGGMSLKCEDCHLTLSETDIYIEVTLDAFAGFKNFALLVDSEVTFHIDSILQGDSESSQTWSKVLLTPFAVPLLSYPAQLNFVGASIGFTVGLKAGVNLKAHMSTSVEGSATYKSDVVGKLKTGFKYDMDTGSRFLSTASTSNKNVNWLNSINGDLTSQLSIRPCLQGGIWGTAGFAEAHGYGEICADVFAKTTLNHKSAGFEVSPESGSSISQALVKLNELLPSTFKTCDVSASAKHDTRLLVEVGMNDPILGADLYAAMDWGSAPAQDDSKDEELRVNAYGPWPMKGLASSVPVASGCLCISACSSNGGGDSNSPAVDSNSPAVDSNSPAPTSTEVNMPNQGVFVEGALSLGGMRLYEWNVAAELAFRISIAQSAQVWVNHVRVDSVAERQVSSRRRLLATTTLDVKFVIYSSSESQASLIASSISSDVASGTLAVSLSNNGITAANSISVITTPTVVHSAAGRNARSLFGLFCTFTLFAALM